MQKMDTNVKQYLIDNRSLLIWSAALTLACVALVALAAYFETTLTRPYYNPAGEYQGYRSPAIVPLLTIPGLVGLQFIGFGNAFLALNYAVRRQPLGFQRIAVLLLPVVFAAALYVNFESDFSFHWRGFASSNRTFKWLMGGSFWTLATTAAVGFALVVSISLARWVMDGFASKT